MSLGWGFILYLGFHPIYLFPTIAHFLSCSVIFNSNLPSESTSQHNAIITLSSRGQEYFLLSYFFDKYILGFLMIPQKIFLYFTQILDVDVKTIAPFHFFLLNFLLRCSFSSSPSFFFSCLLVSAYSL